METWNDPELFAQVHTIIRTTVDFEYQWATVYLMCIAENFIVDRVEATREDGVTEMVRMTVSEGYDMGYSLQHSSLPKEHAKMMSISMVNEHYTQVEERAQSPLPFFFPDTDPNGVTQNGR